jgi:hypothetical protein
VQWRSAPDELDYDDFASTFDRRVRVFGGVGLGASSDGLSSSAGTWRTIDEKTGSYSIVIAARGANFQFDVRFKAESVVSGAAFSEFLFKS